MTSVLLARLAPPAALAALLAMGLLTGRIVLLTGQRDAARAQLGEARALHETDLARLRAAQALARTGQLAEIAALKDDLRRRKMRPIAGATACMLTIATMSCASPRPAPVPILPERLQCPAPELPEALTDPVRIPSFLRGTTR